MLSFSPGRWFAPSFWLGDGDVTPPASAATAPADPDRSTDRYRVLVVDDEALIRRLASGMAPRLRAEIVTAASADEALAIAGALRIDALVADVLLGDGPDGIELARQIGARQPGIAVILMSGYTADDYALDGLPPDTQFLNKPFSSHSLAQCLARARGQEPSRNH